jgi:hypothetical protein
MLGILPAVVDMTPLYLQVRGEEFTAPPPGITHIFSPLPIASLHRPPQAHSSRQKSALLDDARRRAAALMEQKHRLTAEYLAIVEKQVDSFLLSHYGFDSEAVPFNYLDQPPEDMNAVKENLDILLHCLSDVFLPSSQVQTKLIRPTVDRVWGTMLSPLKRELLELQERLLVRKSFAGTAEDDAASLRALDKILADISVDLAYLETMRRLERTVGAPQGNNTGDDLMEASGGGSPSKSVFFDPNKLSDQVPIGGLIVNRLHRLENEHRTVIEHWATR